jgi:hypothetical protein
LLDYAKEELFTIVPRKTLIKSTVRPEPDKTTSHSTKHDKAVQVAGYVEGCF